MFTCRPAAGGRACVGAGGAGQCRAANHQPDGHRDGPRVRDDRGLGGEQEIAARAVCRGRRQPRGDVRDAGV